MLIQKIQGGLGNQMFEYAFIKALSIRNKSDFKLDISDYKTYFRPYELEIFNIEKKYASYKDIPFYERIKIKNRYLAFVNNIIIKPFFRKINIKHHIEREGLFEEGFLNKNEGYFKGYFQNEKYFVDYNSEIRKDFTFKNALSEKNIQILKKLEGKNTVSVHIRRGDYLNKPDYHPVCSKEYYDKSILYIYNNIKNPIFIFFSDDTNRVKENFKGKNYFYIDWNIGKDSRQDMALMSKCRHNIIANSSFSWWGAWLNNNRNKIVIAPKLRSHRITYNSNIVPENRIQF